MLLLAAPILHAEEIIGTAPGAAPAVTYSEVPYYLRHLNETNSERRRLELNKLIHEGLVNADLSDKKTVKAMEPIVANVRVAMDSGLDRTYLEGSSMWLGSAVDFFDREKLQSTVIISTSDWVDSQNVTADGGTLNITPQKIWLIRNQKSSLIAESSNIHEAVITPDAKRAAFVREVNDGTRSEIWTVNMKNRVRKKLIEVPSCKTLVISVDGNQLFYQERNANPDKESAVWMIGFSGGKPRNIGEARLIQTVVGKGKYKNSLVVHKNRTHHLGTTVQECSYGWTKDGKNLGLIKNVSCR